jgi:threonine synthase
MAGGSLITKIDKAFKEFTKLGFVDAGATKIHGAQAAGCGPIASMITEERDFVKPVKTPQTIAKSLAIGNPADAIYARQSMLGSGGFAALPNDDDICAAILALAEHEGIFTETAGGVTLGAAKKLVQQGRIGADDGPVVLCITGQGLKTQDPLVDLVRKPSLIGPKLGDFDSLFGSGEFTGYV